MLPCGMVTEEQTPLERAMARFAGGEDAALGEVYDLASPRVFSFLLRLCGERTLAEDLTQETFLRIHRARGLYRVGAAVMPGPIRSRGACFWTPCGRDVSRSRPGPRPRTMTG